jgi:hypothetical protein
MALSNNCYAFIRKNGMYGTLLFLEGVCHGHDCEEGTVFGSEWA